MAIEPEVLSEPPSAVRCSACKKTLWETGMTFEVLLTEMHGDHEMTVLNFTPVTFVHMKALCPGPDEDFGIEFNIEKEKHDDAGD